MSEATPSLGASGLWRRTGRHLGAAALTGVMARAFGWGAGMAGTRLVCSFLSIKVTAVFLGPGGLALVAQFSNLVNLFQSMLGQGLVTGSVSLGAEAGAAQARRQVVRATALRIALVLAVTAGVVLAFASPLIAPWLLGDSRFTLLIALSGVVIAAGMLTDLLHGALGVGKEVGLIGGAVMTSTVLGLVIFAPAVYFWGLSGALWASFAVMLSSTLVSVTVVRRLSRSVALSDFFGPFDRTIARRLMGFYPMLIVNGALPPLVLILARDTLRAALGLESAGLWQATWRLSEAYQAVIVSGVSLHFMASLGERVHDPRALQRQVLRTLGTATAATAAMALVIGLLREPIVHLVFSPDFGAVADLMPLQLLGDVLKMGGWILSMALVALMRTRWFLVIALFGAACFVGATKALVPVLGIEGVLWAYVGTGGLQVLLGVAALRDVLLPHRP